MADPAMDDAANATPRIPFVDLLGMEFLAWGKGESEIALEAREELCNSWSVIHGGVTMTLLDVSMARAARSPGQSGHPTSPGVVTIEMKTSFMRPAIGRIVGKGKLLQRTASMAFCEASVFDAAGQLVAHATGTFKYLNGLPAGGRTIQRLNASD
jgi:uncharacterized protein (TIGR00369 family)